MFKLYIFISVAIICLLGFFFKPPEETEATDCIPGMHSVLHNVTFKVIY